MSEQEQFEAWWNGDRPTDFTEYGASQWTKAHAYSAWLARASRPREAAVAPYPNAAAPTCPRCGNPVAVVQSQLPDETTGTPRHKNCPHYAAPAAPAAPEACPRCGGKRGDIGRVHDPALDDLIDEETGSLVPLNERWQPCPMCVERETPAMDRMVAEYNAKHAQPASAPAEGGGDVPLFMRACQVLGCGARGVTENAGPWYCALHHPEHPAYATPASAAGREGAVEKVVEAAKALRKAHLRWAEHHEQHDEVCDFGCHAAKQGAEMGFDEALDALLAAEAAARGEKEA